MDMCPSRKELLAVAQMIIAILAILNYYKIDLFDTPMYDIRLFEHQCVSISLGFISLYYSLGTWLWYSNLTATRLIIRIHSLLVYGTLITLLFLTRSRYMVDYGPFIRGIYDHGIFDDEDERMASSMMLIQGIVMLLGIFAVVQINYIIVRVKVLWSKRNRSRND